MAQIDQVKELSPFDRFQAKINRKSKVTQQTYIASVNQFMRECFVNDWETLLDGTVAEQEERIRQYLPQKSHTVANKVFWALRHFYSANQVRLNWDDDLKDYIPAKEAVMNYRARTKAEIEAMLSKAPLREQVAVLIMSTGGIRVGGLPTMLIENGVWIEKYNVYCFLIYPKTDDEYQALFTPQASALIKKYIGRRKSGPLFLSKFGGDYPAGEDTLSQAVRRVAKEAGAYFPYEVQLDHGFRHFFRTALETSRVHDDFAERLMGHKKEKLKKVYSHPDPLELMEASEYYKAFEKLTFTFEDQN